MKKLAITLLTVILLLAAATAALAEYADPAVARVQFNLRKEMDTTSEILANIPIGANLTVSDYPNSEWCQVKYRGKVGYAKTSWLRFRQNRDHVVVTGAPATTPQVTPTPEPEDNRGAQTPKATAEAVVPEVSGGKPREAVAGLTGVAIGESETDEVRYCCMTLTAFNIRETPEWDARKIREVKKGADLRVLAYGDEWCKVQTMDGRFTGYAMTKWLFHYHSLDRFKWEVPQWEFFRSTGYGVMTTPVHITDRRNLYKGNNLQVGDIVTIRKQEGGEYDGEYDILLRRDWVPVDESTFEYHPFVPWNEAKEGDIIGGFTQYFGQRQGGVYYIYRNRNIALAMSFMDGVIIKSGALYSYLGNIGPTTTTRGYYRAGITGGEGSGTGGGVCHTSTLMYEAALSLPFYIAEREPHTDDGTHYAVLEFDATVGVYSDMKFYNTLPYDIKMHAFIDRPAGVITVYFECLETLDAETLANWDWKVQNVPVTEIGL